MSVEECLLTGVTGIVGAVIGCYGTYNLTKKLEENKESKTRCINLSIIRSRLICLIREKIFELNKLGLKESKTHDFQYISLERQREYFINIDKQSFVDKWISVNYRDIAGLSEKDILNLSKLNDQMYKFIYKIGDGKLVDYGAGISSYSEYDEKMYFEDMNILINNVYDYVVEIEDSSEDFKWLENQREMLKNYLNSQQNDNVI